MTNEIIPKNKKGKLYPPIWNKIDPNKGPIIDKLHSIPTIKPTDPTVSPKLIKNSILSGNRIGI